MQKYPQTGLAKRMRHIEPFHVMRILERARKLERAGADIVHMEVGEPDFATPEPIVEAGRRALSEGKTGYTPATGLPELREAIAQFYQLRHGLRLSSQQVVITPGASGALQLVLAALINPGDEVLLTDPGYPCNRHFVELLNGKPVALPVTESANFQPGLEQLEGAINNRTKALMLASPANPTGSVLSRNSLDAYQRLTRRRQVALIVDEIYHGLVYETESEAYDQVENQSFLSGQIASAMSLDDLSNVFVINSFSKYFGMTGWRLGWIIAPNEFIDSLDRLAQNLFLCAPTPAQHAALAAFASETLTILEQRRAEFRRRRNYLYPELNRLGFRIGEKPAGAFYIYADSSALSDDSLQLSTDLLEQAGVALTPGIDFGQYKANQQVRFAYTTNLDRLEEGVCRLGRVLGGY